MKKHIIALAVAAAVAAPAAAMADTTLYGKLNMSYDFWTGDKASNHTHALSSNASRLGIKGSEKISDNLSVIYQYETYVQVAGNSKDSAQKSLFGTQRNSFIGLTGGWGTFLAGKHDTPMKMVGRKYDLFGDTLGDSRNVIRDKNYGDWDRRTPNTVAYVTPNLAGFHAALAYVSDWKTENPQNNNNKAYSLSAGYSIAGFMLDAAYEKHQIAGSTTATDNQDAYRIGAGYTIAGFKIVGLYQKEKDLLGTGGPISGMDRSVYGVGGAYSFGASTVKAQYYKADNRDTTTGTGGKIWAVGYDYKLSKQTKVYAVYAQAKNESNTSDYVVDHQDYGSATFAPDTTKGNGFKSGGFSVGIIHKF